MPSISEVKSKDLQIGDVLQIEDWPRPAAIRKVSIVLHMDNNMDLVVAPTDKLWKVKGK